jgi:hypothetical protein
LGQWVDYIVLPQISFLIDARMSSYAFVNAFRDTRIINGKLECEGGHKLRGICKITMASGKEETGSKLSFSREVVRHSTSDRRFACPCHPTEPEDVCAMRIGAPLVN